QLSLQTPRQVRLSFHDRTGLNQLSGLGFKPNTLYDNSCDDKSYNLMLPPSRYSFPFNYESRSNIILWKGMSYIFKFYNMRQENMC
ncbi:MAG: hypothetical protein OEM26_19500, partial [Saprospiraceae bacterium]|nr:hypothetical protein [Saprospiraceae bacterium]